MKKIVAILPFILLLASCSTSYHSVGLMGGFDDFKVATDTYIVRFQGNGYTSRDLAFKYALRRSAELTKEKGYNYFKMVNSSSDVSRNRYRTPVVANTQSNYNSIATGNYGNGGFNAYGNTTGNSITTYSGGDEISIERPLTQMVIKLYKTQVKGTLDADVILSNFESKK